MAAEALIGSGLLNLKLMKGALGSQFAGTMHELEATGSASSNRFASVVGGVVKAAAAATLGLGAALVGVSAYSIHAATDFQASMTMIRTQAGDTTDDLGKMSAAVLEMAGQVGVPAKQLADGLYHIASAGFRGQQALDMLRSAAELSKVGNADLESSAQAVVGVLAAYGDEGMTAAQAVAQLNAITGSGDMRMQQLTAAMATGILPAAKNFGLTLTDVGAALATLTDNVTPADEAATRLRMTFSLVGAPSAAAQRALKDIGINALDMSEKMRSGKDGFLQAMEMLQSHLRSPLKVNVNAKDLDAVRGQLEAWGLSSDQANAEINKLGPSASVQAMIIARAFGGGRSSAAIMTLLVEMDRLKAKYKDIGAGAKDFGADWTKTQGTFKQQWDESMAKVDAAAIKFGMKLLPIVQRYLPEAAAIAAKAFDILGKVLDALPSIAERVSSTVNNIRTALTNAHDNVVKWQGVLLPLGAVIATFLVPTLINLAVVMGVRAAVAGMQFVASMVRSTVATVAQARTMILNNAQMDIYIARTVVAQAIETTRAVATGIATAAVAVYTGAQQALNFVQAEGVVGTIRYVAALLVHKVAAMGSAAATWLFNVALDANPIGIVVLAIAALVGALVFLITHFQQVQQWVGRVWNEHKVLIGVLLFLLGPVGLVIGAIGALILNWGKVSAAIGTVMSALGGLVNFIGDKVAGALGKLADLAGKAGGALNAINPFSKHSPSLVENVQAGTTAIVGHYKTMADKITEHAQRARGSLQDALAGGGGGHYALALAGGGGGGGGGAYAAMSSRDLVNHLQDQTDLLTRMADDLCAIRGEGGANASAAARRQG